LETTDLDKTVSLLLETPEKPDDDNQSEATAEASEPIQDVESEEVEAVAEGDDDAEYAASEDDAEIDDEAEVDEAVETNELHTVKVYGQEQKWTLEQLIQSASGQGAINQQMQENAQQRKAIEQEIAKINHERNELAQSQQHYVQMFNQIQSGAAQPPVLPEYGDDPIDYVEAKAKYDKDLMSWNNHVYQTQQIQQQQQQQSDAERARFKQEQAAIIAQKHPDITDPVKGGVLAKKWVDTLNHYNISPDILEQNPDSRYVDVINDAAKWRELQSSKKTVQAKGSNVQPVKAGAKKRTTPNAQAKTKALTRMKQTGSVDDVASYLLQS
jgi:hypothetical protein